MDAKSLTFSGSGLDRASAAREDDDWVRGLLRHPSSAAVAASSEGVLLQAGPAPHKVLRLPAADGVVPEPAAAPAILLGLDRGQAFFAVDLDTLAAERQMKAIASGRLASLRDAGAVLGAREAGLAAYLVALLNWHRAHRYCPDCGAPRRSPRPGACGAAPGSAPSSSPAPIRP